MSVYTSATGLSSILKAYSPTQREAAKNAALNKVRFQMPKRENLKDLVNAFLENGNEGPIKFYSEYIREAELDDAQFQTIIHEASVVIHQLSHGSCIVLVEALLCLPWVNRSKEAKHAYADFCIDMLVAQSKFLGLFINNLLALWIPNENEPELWPKGTPNEVKLEHLKETHKLLERLLTVIPVSFNALLEIMERKFPYFKKPSHVVAGYIHNLLWVLEYKPIFNECLLNLILEHLVILDVNAPRGELEETETDDESDNEDDQKEETMFQMDEDAENESNNGMKHPIANTLDICLDKIFTFLDTRNPFADNLSDTYKQQTLQFSKTLYASFDRVILAKYNTHHVQFIMFYYCSFKQSLAENFLNSLWDKVQNPNEATVIRQAAVGYLASFLARASFIPLTLLQRYLKDLCDWAHNYIQNCDQYRSNISLKANLVFYTVCQAVFYMIAFRSRNLTANKKGLLFLETLHLPGLVTSNFNPLRVCLPAVATAFAGVTRTYQLAYCHAILERNARRKLATFYGNDYETPEETLDTFFPFDPYLLKVCIKPIYLQYQASDAEEHTNNSENSDHRVQARKRGDSEMADDIDDFLIVDKRQKLQEREAQFTYGLSPGFHT